MSARRKADLHLVKAPAVDIYAADKERIAAIDWAKVHVRGDRNAPVDLPDRPRRKAFGLEFWR